MNKNDVVINDCEYNINRKQLTFDFHSLVLCCSEKMQRDRFFHILCDFGQLCSITAFLYIWNTVELYKGSHLAGSSVFPIYICVNSWNHTLKLIRTRAMQLAIVYRVLEIGLRIIWI